MPQLFEMDLRQIAKFARLSARAPRQFAAATGMILNDAAFGTREEAINTISETMWIRQPGFVSNRIGVVKSTYSLPIRSQVSEVGSRALPRFSGWIEQQTGEKTDRSRVFTVLARQGSKGRPAIRGARMLPSTDFLEADDVRIDGAKSRDHKEEIFLRMIQRQRYRKPFMIRRHSKFTPGVYRMRGGQRKSKLKLLTSLEPRRVQPKRIPWLTMATDRYLKSNRPRKAVQFALKKVFKRWKI